MNAGKSQSTDALIHVKVLGELQVRRGDTVLRARDFGGRKARQVLEILLINRGTPVSKERLADLIWADAAPPDAMATLESYVSALRRRIQPGRGKNGPLRTVTAGYMLDPALLDLDLDRFNDLIETARHAPAQQAYPLLRDALATAAEPLLADEPNAPWAEAERLAHNTRLTVAIVAAADAATATGRATDAVLLARRALTADPFAESAWTALLRALQGAGRHAEALHSYEQCRQLFIDELGCTPGPALQALHRDLLQGAAESDDSLSELISALLDLHTSTTNPKERANATPAAAAPLKLPGNKRLRGASRLLAKLLEDAERAMQIPA